RLPGWRSRWISSKPDLRLKRTARERSHAPDPRPHERRARRLPPAPAAASESTATATAVTGARARTTRRGGPLLVIVGGGRTALAVLEITLNSLRRIRRIARGGSRLSRWLAGVVPIAVLVFLPSVTGVAVDVAVLAGEAVCAGRRVVVARRAVGIRPRIVIRVIWVAPPRVIPDVGRIVPARAVYERDSDRGAHHHGAGVAGGVARLDGTVGRGGLVHV